MSKPKGWLLEVKNCIGKIKKSTFNLDDIYQYEADLRLKYPNNKNIQQKIRQQLQTLRDEKYLKFDGNGKYTLI